jgi:drug/metabolite transporter (DMT)-like permease
VSAFATTAGRPAVLAGIGMMVLAILMFALNDVMGKWLVATYTVGQVLLIRSIAALVVLAPAVWRAGVRDVLRPPRPGLQFARVVCCTAEVALFYWVVVYLPLADAMTVWMAGPIWAVALAAIVLRETVRPAAWLIVLAGFVGVVVALQPSPSSISLPMAAAVLGSFCFAGMMLFARSLRGTPDITLVFWQNMGALVLGAMLVPFGWVTPSLVDFALLALLGVVAMLAHLCVTRSLKLAPASTVVPYQYTIIVWAIVFGWFVFGDAPTLAMLAGAAIVLVAGLVLIALEARWATAERRDDPVTDPPA